MEALTVLWRILDFFFVPNWFLCADSTNDDTSVVLALCWSPSRNFSSTSPCVNNVHHLYQFPDFLVAVALDISLVMSTMLLYTISRG